MLKMSLFKLTKELINIPSDMGNEAKIADFLLTYLKKQNFLLREQKIEGNRRNILSTTGSEAKIILCTHMDTVPPYISASEDERYIYGRGACDAKGIMASMIWAAQDLKKEGVTDFGLLFVVGEETDSIGAKKANSLNIGSNFIIVGEPTENKLALGHKGVITFTMRAKGRQAHSAYPRLGESAIEKLLDALQKIRTLNFGQDPVLGESTLNIGTIEGGIAHNIIANSASAEVCIRNVQPSEQILGRLKSVIKQEVKIKVLNQSEPQRLFTVPGFDKVILPYGTDIPYLKSLGKPLLLGPGSGSDAHTESEKIEKSQLVEAVNIYKDLVKKLLSLGEKA